MNYNCIERTQPRRLQTPFMPGQRRIDVLNAAFDRHQNLVMLSAFNMIFLNDLIYASIIDLDNPMRQSTLYRQKAKQLWNRIVAERVRMERIINEVVGASENGANIFADANDRYCTEVQRHIDMVRITVKQALDNARAPHAALFADIETARLLADVSCRQCDFWVEKLGNADRALTQLSSLDYIRPTTLHALFEEFCNIVFRINQDISLMGNEQCVLASKILVQKLRDPNITYRAATAADEAV